jgi:hypothetical protein
LTSDTIVSGMPPVQHTQRGNALVARGRGGGNVAAQREAKQADAA